MAMHIRIDLENYAVELIKGAIRTNTQETVFASLNIKIYIQLLKMVL